VKVLVTGAGGFIGSHVTEALLSRGHEVHAVVRTDGPKRLCVDKSASFDWLTIDLDDVRATREAITKVQPQAAVHLAWYAKPGQYWTAPENLECVKTTLSLAQILAEAGCPRLIAAGSCAEYDWDYGFCSEDCTPLRPATLYGTCKDATRRLLEAFCAEKSISFAWTRFFHLYGPREAPGRLVSSITTSLLRGSIAKCTDGEQRRDFLHVADAAAAVCAVLEADVLGPVNIASGVPVRVREIAETLARILGAEKSLEIGGLLGMASEPPLLLADVRRLRRETAWQPKWSLESGLENSVTWWRHMEANS